MKQIIKISEEQAQEIVEYYVERATTDAGYGQELAPADIDLPLVLKAIGKTMNIKFELDGVEL